MDRILPFADGLEIANYPDRATARAAVERAFQPCTPEMSRDGWLQHRYVAFHPDKLAGLEAYGPEHQQEALAAAERLVAA